MKKFKLNKTEYKKAQRKAVKVTLALRLTEEENDRFITSMLKTGLNKQDFLRKIVLDSGVI